MSAQVVLQWAFATMFAALAFILATMAVYGAIVVWREFRK